MLTNAMRMFDERVAQRWRIRPEPVAEAVDEDADGVDRQRSRRQVRWLGRQVDGGELVQPHHVVGDDDLGGHLGETRADVLDRLLGLVDQRLGSVRLGGVRVSARWRVVGGLIGRGIVGHVSYPSGAISKRSGGDPHPATTTA